MTFKLNANGRPVTVNLPADMPLGDSRCPERSWHEVRLVGSSIARKNCKADGSGNRSRDGRAIHKAAAMAASRSIGPAQSALGGSGVA